MRKLLQDSINTRLTRQTSPYKTLTLTALITMLIACGGGEPAVTPAATGAAMEKESEVEDTNNGFTEAVDIDSQIAVDPDSGEVTLTDTDSDGATEVTDNGDDKDIKPDTSPTDAADITGADEESINEIVADISDATPVINPITEEQSQPPDFSGPEDRTAPLPGTVLVSNNDIVRANGADLFSNTGPQNVNADRVASWPGLRYGDFLVTNNPWNYSAAAYPHWYQSISLIQTKYGYGAKFDWDWGTSGDSIGSFFNTKSYPHVNYGTKSEYERSGTFQTTGLPVEIFSAPEITIDYDFDYEARRSESSTQESIDSEFNVAIDSFFHDSCDITNTGSPVDNRVFEMMVWLKTGVRKPAGGAPIGVVTTSDGRTFDVYAKNHYFPYIAYVAQEEQLTGTVQFSELLAHTVDNAALYGLDPLNQTDCLANIAIGTEIWHGAGSFNLHNFQITRRY